MKKGLTIIALTGTAEHTLANGTGGVALALWGELPTSRKRFLKLSDGADVTLAVTNSAPPLITVSKIAATPPKVRLKLPLRKQHARASGLKKLGNGHLSFAVTKRLAKVTNHVNKTKKYVFVGQVHTGV